jgi:hypothetical protein
VLQPPSTFQRWTPQQVVAAFEAAGCEAHFPKPLVDVEWAETPRLAVDTLRVINTSLSGEVGARVLVFSFANQADLDTTRQSLLEQARSAEDYSSRLFSRDNILVQALSLPDVLAQQYDVALQAIK